LVGQFRNDYYETRQNCTPKRQALTRPPDLCAKSSPLRERERGDGQGLKRLPAIPTLVSSLGEGWVRAAQEASFYAGFQILSYLQMNEEWNKLAQIFVD
ncbi:MAG: hypothetical protein MUF71_15030, partial [Candidatus Kapabacteria bacterium]|nr:hypothetical protein [Candidatus Kapabacteria bacterium]